MKRRLPGMMTRLIRKRIPPGVTVTGLVLAGGRGARAGGRDKGLLSDHGRPMASRGLDWLAPWCSVLAVSANRHLSRYRLLADLVVADCRPHYPGPLAGVAACLGAVRTHCLLTCPCDATGLPVQVPPRLLRALRVRGRADVAVVRDRRRLQPLVAAWRGTLGPEIEAYLDAGGRSVQGFLATRAVVEVPIRAVLGNRNEIPERPAAGAQ